MSKNDLSDEQLLAMGKKEKPIRKRVLFKEYCGTYINLGLQNRDSKTMKKELVAITKRGAELVMKSIIKKTKMPTKLPKGQQLFITVVIHAGIMNKLDNAERVFMYPDTGEYNLEEV